MKTPYQVTVIFDDGHTMDDIVLTAIRGMSAKETACYKIEQRWPTATFKLKRISQAHCENIVNLGGIDWAN